MLPLHIFNFDILHEITIGIFLSFALLLEYFTHSYQLIIPPQNTCYQCNGGRQSRNITNNVLIVREQIDTYQVPTNLFTE